MNKKVSYKEFRKEFKVVESKVERASKRLPHGKVYICDDSGAFGNNMVNLKINWSACGEQSIADTAKFVRVLTMAVVLASAFKYNGYEITYED